uniref:Uncharacterized protein n=1 Tax=Meloidogyne enterolobii TaxID=390850 RepID=A0A6V7U5N7_MELEN|nr:unnamed protein product [Meloidogyne enterolobii]
MSKIFIVFVIFTIVFVECCVGAREKQKPKSTNDNGAAEIAKNASKHATKNPPTKGSKKERDPLYVYTDKNLSTYKDPRVNLYEDDSCVSDGK